MNLFGGLWLLFERYKGHVNFEKTACHFFQSMDTIQYFCNSGSVQQRSRKTQKKIFDDTDTKDHNFICCLNRKAPYKHTHTSTFYSLTSIYQYPQTNNDVFTIWFLLLLVLLGFLLQVEQRQHGGIVDRNSWHESQTWLFQNDYWSRYARTRWNDTTLPSRDEEERTPSWFVVVGVVRQ